MNYIKTMSIICLMLLWSCNESPLSKKKINKLNKLKVLIEINQDPYTKNKNSIVLRVFDQKNRQINNDDLQIKVNDSLMTKKVINNLYYSKTIKYVVRNIVVNEAYFFEIKLSDSIGTVFDLAYIRPIPTISEGSIFCEKENRITEPTEISWKNLEAYNKLRIWKSTKEKLNKNSFAGGPYAQSTINKKIKPNGTYSLDTSFYTDSATIATRINIDFISIKKGLINSDLLNGSDITLTTEINKVTKIIE